jgi:hypothetical protein
VSNEWEALHSHCDLQSLSSLCSDHAPLLLTLDAEFVARKRFHFRAFWPRFPGFLDVVKRVWNCPLCNVRPFARLDWLLWHTARMLKSWSDRSIGSIRSHLEVTKEVVYRLEVARNHQGLSAQEEGLRQFVKLMSLGLSSLQRTIVDRSRSSYGLVKGMH